MTMISVTINGDSKSLPEHITTLTDLIAFLKLTEAHRIIEINGKIIQKEAYQSTCISANDCIEIIQFVGGGS